MCSDNISGRILFRILYVKVAIAQSSPALKLYFSKFASFLSKMYLKVSKVNIFMQTALSVLYYMIFLMMNELLHVHYVSMLA